MSDSRLYNQLDRIESKVDTLDGRLDAVDLHMAKYNKELEYHVARTTQLEEQLLPISKRMERVQGAFSLLAVISAVLALIGSFSFLFTK